MVLGLDNAGKTTILKAMSKEDYKHVMPTQGFNIKSLMQDNFKLNVWDIGGQKSIRPYWRNYFDDTDALVYVVDSADKARVGETNMELSNLMNEEKLEGVPTLIFANKQDLLSAQSHEDLFTSLNLNQYTDRSLTIQPCSAKSGEGLQEGMEWLVEQINNNSA